MADDICITGVYNVFWDIGYVNRIGTCAIGISFLLQKIKEAYLASLLLIKICK